MRKTSESVEDYLEAILRLSDGGGSVRQVDVAEFLGFSKASISKAVSALRKGGLLRSGKDRTLVLTPAGRSVAEAVYERHRFFAGLLVELGVDPEVAQQDACRMEHAVSEESFNAIRNFTIKVSSEL